jgi:hypothetical protein
MGRGFGLVDCRFDSSFPDDVEFGTSLFDPLVFRPNDEKNPPVDFVGASGIGGGRWRTVDVGETSIEVRAALREDWGARDGYGTNGVEVEISSDRGERSVAV